MANIHVLTKSGALHRLVYHFATPAGSNSAGVLWSTAIANSKIDGATVMVSGDGTGGTITSAEASAIVAGTTIEMTRDLDVTQGGANTTLAQIQAYVTADYNANKAQKQADLQAALGWFGQTV